MAFHVACPITCRQICFCSLGFSLDLNGGKFTDAFLKQVDAIEEVLWDPWCLGGVSRERTVQVRVPKLEIPSPALIPAVSATQAEAAVTGDGGDYAVEEAAAVSVQKKLATMQRKAAASIIGAEDYTGRFESGDVEVPVNDIGREELSHSSANLPCRMCFLRENEGSQRARRMLSCKSCGKKYHRSCLKVWSQHRDLFHWSSWTCPSCRICEACQITGDPNKFTFCKRCDAAYHCYCQHPPHKNVSAGPFLCPKHTKCHSCGSSVPGNGMSLRWFLGYTCCDACGRLFVKGNYCPVCLKVYRDSESTPMVCCDFCQRWVHCQCDEISDEKYLQFQVDGNLQYKCATCRGKCYQVKDLGDAVQELWKRKDMADRELIVSLRAAAGLPTEDELFSISPYSDDGENIPVTGRSLKFSLDVADRSLKKSKEHGNIYSSKKYTKNKGSQAFVTGKSERLQDSDGYDFCDKNEDGMDKSSGLAGVGGQSKGVPHSINHIGVPKHKFVEEGTVSDEDKQLTILKIRTSRSHDLDSEDTGKLASKPHTVKAKKLVINLGPRKANADNSLSFETSNRQGDQDLASNGDKANPSGHMKGLKISGDKANPSGHIKGLKISGKFGKVQSDDTVTPEKKHVPLGKDREESRTLRSKGDIPLLRGGGGSIGKHSEGRADLYGEGHCDHDPAPALHSAQKEARPLLKFKLKRPNPESQDSQAPPTTYERSNSIKGQRSKRKRPSPSSLEKSYFNEDEDVLFSCQDRLVDGMLDASWILKKLGKGAKGKRVEIHEASDNSW